MRRVGQRWSRFGRFNIVGLLGAALQLLLLALLTKWFRASVITATPLAVEIVVLHNFVWHERFTWRDRRFNSMRQRALGLWRFHAGNGLTSLLGNMILSYCFVERLNFPVLPSAAGAIVLCSLVNFFLADRWAYARALTQSISPPGVSQTFSNRVPGPDYERNDICRPYQKLFLPTDEGG